VRKHSGAAPARQRSLPPNSCVLGLGEPDRPSGLGQGVSRVPEPPDRAPRSGTLRFEQPELPARCRPARSPARKPAGHRGLERKLWLARAAACASSRQDGVEARPMNPHGRAAHGRATTAPAVTPCTGRHSPRASSR
jgi:hypothetical protein